jgi:predicted GNAT family acetyltransferase
MKLVKEESRIALVEEDGKLVGEVTFPVIDGVIQINHTFVDEAYRGQGIAGQLLDEVVKTLRERGVKALPVCAYSVSYFAKHPENQDVIRR